MVETLHTFWSSNRHSFFSSDTHVLALRGNEYNGKAENGYYIGQQHEGNTEVKVVRSTERGKDGYMAEVPEGAPGTQLFRVCCSACIGICCHKMSAGSTTFSRQDSDVR